MIKCNVTACGCIISSAEEKTNKDGNKFMSFALSVPLQGRDQSVKEVRINVSAPWDAGQTANYTTGRRATITGILYIRKYEGNTYFNLRTDQGIELNESTVPDRLEGTMEFTGKIGKKGIEDHKSKKGKDIQTFSAFSSDKDGDKREFTWVNFLNLSPIHADYLAAEKYVHVCGELKLDVYKSSLQLECLVKSVSAWGLNNTSSDSAAQD